MTTPHKHAALIHAFADGKVLQYKDTHLGWVDYQNEFCPSFGINITEWQIKPNEPKKVVISTFINSRGHVAFALKGTKAAGDYYTEDGWKYYPELDREVTLPTEGE